MADKTIEVKLKASDSMSAVFKKLSDASKTLEQSFEEVESSSKQAAKAIDESGQAAEGLKQKLKEADEAGRQMGQGLLVIGGAAALAGQSYREQQIAIDNLQRSYGIAADDMLDFAERLQDTTNFSNDAAMAAANTAATLARNYGFTADEIQQVLQLSADLAAANGTTLEYATQAVTAALRGEAEMAEQLGLTLNQQAIDREGLTLAMDNQSAAHFRLNAALDQGAYATGAAAQQADSAYGAFKDWADSAQDLGQTIGGSLGPIGELGALISDYPIQTAAAVLGIRELAQALGAANDASKLMTGMNVGSLGLSGLTALLTGPAGIVVAAGLAGVAVKEFAGTLGTEFHQVSDESIASIDALIAKIVELGDTSALAQTVLGLDTIKDGLKQTNDEANSAIGIISANLAELNSVSDGLAETIEDGIPTDFRQWDGLTQAQKEYIDANKNGIITIEEANAALGTYEAQAASTQEIIDGLAAGADELGQIFVMQGKGAALAKSEAAAYTQALMDGKITGDQYEGYLQSLIVGYGNVQTATALATAEQEAKTGVTKEEAKSQAALNDEYQRFLDLDAQRAGESGEDYTMMINREEAARNAANHAMQEYLDLEQQAAGAAFAAGVKYDSMRTSLDAYIDTVREQIAVEAEQRAAASERFGDTGLADLRSASASQMKEIVGQFQSAFEIISSAPEALDLAFQAIVGNTDQLASSANAVNDWAIAMGTATEHTDELGNVLGTWSRLDELLVENGALTRAATIDQNEYNAAQEAFRDIGRENEEIQQDIAVIQAKQAPILGELMEQTENYLQTVAEMDGIQQTAALGFMDTAESQRALELQTLALDAATGALGTNGREWASGIIEGAAMADPVLASMLLSMGLISESIDENGNKTFTVNFEDNASGPLQDIVGAIDTLNESTLLLVAMLDDDPFTNTAQDVEDKLTLLGDIESIPTVSLDDQATGPIGDIESDLIGVGDITATPTVDVQDQASGTLGSIRAQLDGLYDKTIYVNTVYTSSGSVGAGFLPERHGGIPGFAHGGIPVELAEVGTEMLHFANGGVLPIYDHGYYEVPRGTYVSPNNAVGDAAGGITINVSFSGAQFQNGSREAMNAWAAEEFIPALRAVIQDTRRGQVS